MTPRSFQRDMTRRRVLQLSGVAASGLAIGAGASQHTLAAQDQATPTAFSGTLTLWDQWASGAASEGMDQLVAMFEEKHPEVQIQRDVYEAVRMREVVGTALGANTGPDLMYFDLGYSLNLVVQANELAPLDDAYEKYGWSEKIVDIAQEWVTLDGKRYALPHEFEFEPVFYNKAIYEELGLSVPQTHDEFLSNCEACKEAGYIPITLGNAGNGELRHTFGFPLNNLVGKEGMDAIALCGASWDTPEVLEAVRLVTVEYPERGFYPEHVNGIQGQDANNLFFTQEAAHRMTGTWFIQDIVSAGLEDEVDMFLYPAFETGEALPQGWFGSGYQLPVDSSQPELALEFMDFLYSEEAVKVWVEVMNVVPPMPIDASGLELNSLTEKWIETLFSPDQQFGWMAAAFAPQELWDLMNVGFQQIIAGEKTPEQQVTEMQEVWQRAIDNGDYTLKC